MIARRFDPPDRCLCGGSDRQRCARCLYQGRRLLCRPRCPRGWRASRPHLDRSPGNGNDEESEVILHLQEHPEVEPVWLAYKPQWDLWRQQRESLDPEYQTYVDMFRMYQRVQQSGEQYELRLGVGLLEGGFPAAVKRHLVSAPIDLEMEDDGTITVREASFESLGFALEGDMLPTDAQPSVVTADQTRTMVAGIDDLLDLQSVEAALSAWFSAVDVDGRFEHSWGPLPKGGSDACHSRPRRVPSQANPAKSGRNL